MNFFEQEQTEETENEFDSVASVSSCSIAPLYLSLPFSASWRFNLMIQETDT